MAPRTALESDYKDHLPGTLGPRASGGFEEMALVGSLALALETPGSDVDLVRFSQTDWNRNPAISEAVLLC